MSLNSNTGSLEILFDRNRPRSLELSKKIQVFSSELKTVASTWQNRDLHFIGNLLPGQYMVRITLASGEQQDKVVEIKSQENTQLTIELETPNLQITTAWFQLIKSFSKSTVSPRKDFDRKHYIFISATLWSYQEHTWRSKELPELSGAIPLQIFSTELIIEDGMNVLQLTETVNESSVFIALPPDPKLQLLISASAAPKDVSFPLEVKVCSNDEKAETLLTLITTGAVDQAKSFYNAQEAESYLYNKIESPVSAAIGGYFLLKIKDLDRLHNWPNNLANWFPWLPDGSIIHAWQMLLQPNAATNVAFIKSRFLEAMRRGIPFHTEGMRLLRDGLCELSFFFRHEDRTVEKALQIVKNLSLSIDWSQANTTFLGQSENNLLLNDDELEINWKIPYLQSTPQQIREKEYH